jgi:tetratricopeptide (TPR) repeat protein
LTELFPEEAHFWAHLGRLYSLELKQFKEAVDAIDKSLSLPQGESDHVLHHMKGMALRAEAYFLMEKGVDVGEVVKQAQKASESFSEARKLSPTDEHGYISETQMIARVLDYCGRKQDMQPIESASTAIDPWLRECLQTAEDLLMQVRKSRLSETPSEHEQRCRADLDVLYGNHEQALQIWDNLLSRKDSHGRIAVYAPPIRRQIIWTYLARKGRHWDNLAPVEIERTVCLLEDNLKEDRNVERDLRLWIQAIRRMKTPPSIETIIEKVAYWKSVSDSLDATYYLYVIHTLQAMAGSVLSRDTALRGILECRTRARFRLDRTKSWEWLGTEHGIRQLIHHDRLGEWDNFWTNPSLLKRIRGVITRIEAPQEGFIEFAGGLKAFFPPAISGHYKGRSENQAVSFYLGFSYDGLRAWSVENS